MLAWFPPFSRKVRGWRSIRFAHFRLEATDFASLRARDPRAGGKLLTSNLKHFFITFFRRAAFVRSLQRFVRFHGVSKISPSPASLSLTRFVTVPAAFFRTTPLPFVSTLTSF